MKKRPSRFLGRMAAPIAFAFCACLAVPARSQPLADPIGPTKATATAWAQASGSGFMENKGQITDQNGKPNKAIKYLLNMPGLNVQLRPTGFSYDAWVDEIKGGKQKSSTIPGMPAGRQRTVRRYHRVDIDLQGANPRALLVAEEPLAARVNVYGGTDRFDNLHSYNRVTYQNIYPGIDLEFLATKGTDRPVEYNFIIRPGADAGKIKMRYKSGAHITLKNGQIEMDLCMGTLRETLPASFTRGDGHSLAVRYRPVEGTNNTFAFNVPGYDRGKTLVIDPTPQLVWGTYLGGTNTDYVNAVELDALGNVYVTGDAQSQGLGTGGSVFQNTLAGSDDAFAAAFTSTGTELWFTYYGTKSNGAFPYTAGNALKASGTALYVAGQALENGVTNGTPGNTQQPIYGGGHADGFLINLNIANGSLVWGTYYGGTGVNPGGYDAFTDVAVASDGSIYAVGITHTANGANIIATPGTYSNALNAGNSGDAMLVKFNANGGRIWGTYYGGPNLEGFSNFIRPNDGLDGIVLALDAADNPYIAGTTGSLSNTGITTGATGPIAEGQTAVSGHTFDGFLARFSSTNGTLTWGRYLGGTDNSQGTSGQYQGIFGMAIDKVNSTIYLTGLTMTTDGLATAGTFQTANAGGKDAFLMKLSTAGTKIWGTYVGTAISDWGEGVAVDALGYVYMSGTSFDQNSSLPTTGLATPGSYQQNGAGGYDVFVNKFSPDGSTRVWGTYYGGPGYDAMLENNLALDNLGHFYVVGSTQSRSGIATAGSFQPTYTGAGSYTGFIAKFVDSSLIILPVSLLDFSGKLTSDRNTQLAWTTVSEQANKYFEVEMGRNGTDFVTLGTVPSKGSSTAPQQYTYLHVKPQPGTSYYRLKQTDIDGRFSYSKTIAVDIGTNGTQQMSLYPVPAHSAVTVNFGAILAKGELTVYSADMKAVLSRPLNAASAKIDLDISALPNGIYYLKVTGGANDGLLKFVKQ